jgi:hypothetical protein
VLAGLQGGLARASPSVGGEGESGRASLQVSCMRASTMVAEMRVRGVFDEPLPLLPPMHRRHSWQWRRAPRCWSLSPACQGASRATRLKVRATQREGATRVMCTCCLLHAPSAGCVLIGLQEQHAVLHKCLPGILSGGLPGGSKVSTRDMLMHAGTPCTWVVAWHHLPSARACPLLKLPHLNPASLSLYARARVCQGCTIRHTPYVVWIVWGSSGLMMIVCRMAFVICRMDRTAYDATLCCSVRR